jgi:hypothetical protein
LHAGQISGGLITTIVLPQLLHFQVFSGIAGLFSVIAIFSPFSFPQFNTKNRKVDKFLFQ